MRAFACVSSDYNSGIPRLDEAFNHIRVLLLHLEIYKAHCPLDDKSALALPTLALKKAWDDLWAATAISLRKFAREKELDPEEQSELALQAFALLDGFEGKIQQTIVIDVDPSPGEDRIAGRSRSPIRSTQ